MDSPKPEAETFKQMAEEILQSHPDKLSLFKQHWENSEFNYAYIIWVEFNQEYKVELTKEQDQVDEQFYWNYIN